MSNEKACFVCGTTSNIEKHHIYEGSERSKSEIYGCWCYLCAYHHRLQGGLSHNPIPMIDKYLKQECQRRFEENHSHVEFMNIFKRNWI